MSGPENCDVCDRFIEEDDGMVVAHEDCLDTDDARDGRALRLLREAVDSDDRYHPVRLEHWYGPWVKGGREVQVEVKLRSRVYRRGRGDTIAEAADACRAAIEARS